MADQKLLPDPTCLHLLQLEAEGKVIRVSRYLGHFCAASMQHEGRRVNVRRCSSSRRGDASFTRFHRMTRSRFSLARDDPLFYVGLEVSSPPCYTWR
jgi:hypothetical protein